MHARWYQPTTGTFASRDTATLGSDPSVQTNRYTYGNASPLTNTDPTGHGAYCSNCPAPPVQNMPGYMCTNGICVRPDVTERWWNDYVNSPGFDYYNNPQLSDDEVKRLGYKYMPNGRPVDQPNFWFADEDVQNAYMERWSPLLSDRDLAFNWVSVGGMDSMAKMLEAARKNAGARGGGRQSAKNKFQKKDARIPTCVSQGKNQYNCPDFPYFRYYMFFLQYEKTILYAAKEHGIDPAALMATLIYENLWLEPKTGPIAHLLPGDSHGVAQMQIPTADRLLRRYYKNTLAKIYKTPAEIKNMLIDNIQLSIRLAAAYMRYLKETYRLPDGRGGSRPLNDWKAAVAYAITPEDYVAWKSGKIKPKYPEWQKRESYVYGWVGDAAREYWACLKAHCHYYLQDQDRD